MIDMDKVLELHDRRNKVSAMKPICPRCTTNQVQIINWFTDAVGMKCRHCKYRFTLEVS